MTAKVQSLRSLSRAERRALVQAWFLLLASDAALIFFPLPVVQKVLARLPLPEPGPDVSCTRLAYLVGVAARHHLRRVPCLQRSVALHEMLRRQGLAPELRIGVRREGGTLQAHAWLLFEGLPLGEPGDIEDRFLPLTRYRSDGSDA